MGLYQPLFHITVRHPYFYDNICRDLHWEPSGPTRQAMANLGMLFRSDATGVTVHYDSHRQEALALFADQAVLDTPGLFFKAYTQNPFFMNFTDLPELQKDRLRLVDTSRAVSEKSGQIRLHQKAVVCDQDSARISELRTDSVLECRDLGSPPVCVVHIRPVGKRNTPLDPEGKVHTRSYLIGFGQRRTLWKYYVLGPLAAHNIFIEDVDNKWRFECTDATTISAKGPTTAFISKKPIPLTQTPAYHFQLKLRGARAEKVVIQKLPAAPVNILHREQPDAKAVYVSEIYIHS